MSLPIELVEKNKTEELNEAAVVAVGDLLVHVAEVLVRRGEYDEAKAVAQAYKLVAGCPSEWYDLANAVLVCYGNLGARTRNLEGVRAALKKIADL